MSNRVDIAYEKAQAVLAQECSPLGLMASPEGYPHVWARDSVITGLGTILTSGHKDCLRTSLQTRRTAIGVGGHPQ